MKEYQKKVKSVIRSNPYVRNFVTVTGVGQFIQSNYGGHVHFADRRE